jgi:DNA-binding NarL/FixJ family response regulator
MNVPPEAAAAPIRLLLVDDHPVVLAGLAAVLEFEPRLRVVAQGTDGGQAVALFREHRPDVALLDVRMPGLDGPGAAGRIRAEFPDARLLMLSTSEADADVRRALDAGARGYLLKTACPEELVDAVLTVHAGGRWVPAALVRPAGAPAAAALSPRQAEVLELLAKGLSNKEIAAVLGFSEDGAKAHLKAIYAKLGVRDRTEAVVAAIQRGLVRLG